MTNKDESAQSCQTSWDTIQTIEVVYFQISVVKEDNMSGILPSNGFTDRTVASVDVYCVVI